MDQLSLTISVIFSIPSNPYSDIELDSINLLEAVMLVQAPFLIRCL